MECQTRCPVLAKRRGARKGPARSVAAKIDSGTQLRRELDEALEELPGLRRLTLEVPLLGDLEHSSDALTLPHPELRSRRFVLEPLLELSPDLTLPDGTPYRVSDPHLLAWVHVTETISFLDGWIRYAEPRMPLAEQDAYFAETARIESPKDVLLSARVSTTATIALMTNAVIAM